MDSDLVHGGICDGAIIDITNSHTRVVVVVFVVAVFNVDVVVFDVDVVAVVVVVALLFFFSFSLSMAIKGVIQGRQDVNNNEEKCQTTKNKNKTKEQKGAMGTSTTRRYTTRAKR